MHNRAEHYDEKFDLRNNHYLMVVPAGGLRDGWVVLNDWNLDEKRHFEDHDAAVEWARNHARGIFDGVVAYHEPVGGEDES